MPIGSLATFDNIHESSLGSRCRTWIAIFMWMWSPPAAWCTPACWEVNGRWRWKCWRTCQAKPSFVVIRFHGVVASANWFLVVYRLIKSLWNPGRLHFFEVWKQNAYTDVSSFQNLLQYLLGGGFKFQIIYVHPELRGRCPPHQVAAYNPHLSPLAQPLVLVKMEGTGSWPSTCWRCWVGDILTSWEIGSASNIMKISKSPVMVEKILLIQTCFFP